MQNTLLQQMFLARDLVLMVFCVRLLSGAGTQGEHRQRPHLPDGGEQP